MHEAPGAGRKVRALGARACVCQWGSRGASGAHAKRGRLEVIVGAQGTHADGERTWNIQRMSVTLDVSKFSGLSNSIAP